MSYCGCHSNRINLEAQTDSETQVCPDCGRMVTVPNLVLRLARAMAGVGGPPAPRPLLPMRGQEPTDSGLRTFNPTTAPPGLPGLDHVTAPPPAVAVLSTPSVSVKGWTPLHLGSTAPAARVPPAEGRWFEIRAPFDCVMRKLEPHRGGFKVVDFMTGGERYPGDDCDPIDWVPPTPGGAPMVLSAGQAIGFVVRHTSDIPQDFVAVLYVEPRALLMLSDKETWGDFTARVNNEQAIGSIALACIRKGCLVSEATPLLFQDAEGIYGIHHVRCFRDDFQYWSPILAISLLPHPRTDPGIVGYRVADTASLRSAQKALDILVSETTALSCLTEKNIGGRGVGRRGSYLETWRVYRDLSERLNRVKASLLGPPPGTPDWQSTPSV